jgi:hypothetical protein
MDVSSFVLEKAMEPDSHASRLMFAELETEALTNI